MKEPDGWTGQRCLGDSQVDAGGLGSLTWGGETEQGNLE